MIRRHVLQKIDTIAVRFKEINSQIEDDINSVIESIRTEVFFVIDADLDLYFLKEFARYYPRCLLRRKAEVLLDTVFNYLIRVLLEELKELEYEKQYEFFKLNLRNRIREKVMDKYPEREFKSLKIEEKERFYDRLKAAFPGIFTGLSGTAIAFYTLQNYFPFSLLFAVAGILGLFYSLVKLKRKKEKIKRMKNSWKREIESYLKSAKKSLRDWLNLAFFEFLFEWERFCERVKAVSVREIHPEANSASLTTFSLR